VQHDDQNDLCLLAELQQRVVSCHWLSIFLASCCHRKSPVAKHDYDKGVDDSDNDDDSSSQLHECVIVIFSV